MLTPDEIRDIEHELVPLPDRRSGCIEALKVVQRHRGWVSDEGVADIAGFLGVSPADVDSVATFYNLIFRRPVGRHVIMVCDSVSCWILGYENLRHALERKLGIPLGGTTPDGRFTLLPIVCLGACDHAPALMVDGETFQDVDPQGLDAILRRFA